MVDVGNKTRILGSVEGCGYEKEMGLMGVERLLNYVYINFIQFHILYYYYNIIIL